MVQSTQLTVCTNAVKLMSCSGSDVVIVHLTLLVTVVILAQQTVELLRVYRCRQTCADEVIFWLVLLLYDIILPMFSFIV